MIGFYGGDAARRSLRHFLAGRATSGVLGFLWLLGLVRQLAPQEYATYVAGLATVEMFYLLTGLGLSTLAQRYVAEFRIHAPRSQFSTFLGQLWMRRLAYAIVPGIPLAMLLPRASSWLGVPLSDSAIWPVTLWLVLGSLQRFQDEVFPALLLQGLSQALAVAANAVRLASLAVLQWWPVAPPLETVLWAEVAAAVLAVGMGQARLRAYVRLHPGSVDGAWHVNASMPIQARQLYVVQVLGQLWSGNAARLVVTRLAGAASAAPFGFCLALIDMLRKYLPAYLLANWVRPLMVARYVQHGDVARVVAMASLVLKLSVLGVLPLLVLFAIHGEPLLLWLSGGRYGPGLGPVLVALSVWLLLQCVHVVVGSLGVVLERSALNLRASSYACASLFVLVTAGLLPPTLVVVLTLCAAEVIWISTMLAGLAPGLGHARLGFAGLARQAIGVVLAGALLWLIGADRPWQFLLAMVLAAAVTLAWAVFSRLFSADEWRLLRASLPARWRRS
jgi:O-antigen/teichoic acid export membrane protein